MQTEPTPTMPDLLTCEEAARIIDVHVATVRRWIKEGQLPAIKYGRTIKIKRDVLLQQQQTPAQS